MAKKLMAWKTKGMNQDLSVSAFNPEFAFENMNLRLSTNEGNTLMSWVNEKGTAEIMAAEYWTKTVGEVTTTVYDDPKDEGWEYHKSVALNVRGIPVGTAVLNHYLVLFTHDKAQTLDHIYKLKYNTVKNGLILTELFSGDLNFSTENPLETLVSYESESIQKVYWVDGRNQPRLINIAVEAKKESSRYLTTQFDFVNELQLNETITVEKQVWP